MGCVSEAGHLGRHKVRVEPATWTADAAGRGAYPAGGAAAGPKIVARPEALARVRSLAGAAAALDLELAGLVGDLRALLAAVQDRGGVIRRRFLALRKALIKSRAQVARMRREWEDEAEKPAAGEDDEDEEA